MLRVGLTGGIGSGKSTASRLFAQLGVPVIDADELARNVVEPGEPALEAVRRAFGSSIIDNEGRLDRRTLRERVFADPAALRTLEAILHPAIRAEIRRRVTEFDTPYCIIAIPLLVEKGWDAEVDRVLVIDASLELQLARAQARDQMSRESAEAILRTQASREERLAKADDVIVNNGDLASLREQVTMIHERYLALARSDQK